MENNKKDRYESVSGKGYKSKKPVKKRKRNKPVFSNLKKIHRNSYRNSMQ